MSEQKINVQYASRDGLFLAEAEYCDGKCTVKKGSHINAKTGSKLSSIVLQNRTDKAIVNDEFIVLRDVLFSSASLAAQFVSGNVTNGLRAWKFGKQSLGELTNGKRRKPKKED